MSLARRKTVMQKTSAGWGIRRGATGLSPIRGGSSRIDSSRARAKARRRERDVVLPDGTTHVGRTPVHWRRVALMVAKMTGKRVGLDTATRMGMDADFSDRGETDSRPAREPVRKAELQAKVRNAMNNR